MQQQQQPTGMEPIQQQQMEQQQNPCAQFNMNFISCLRQNNSQISMC